MGVVYSYVCSAQQVFTYNSVADASVWVGNVNQNYGATTFQVKNATSAGITRYGFLKFDLGSITPSQVGKATLRLYCTTKQDVATKITAFSTSTDWEEQSLTYNNRPDFNAPLSTATITSANNYYEWDVTNYIKLLVANSSAVSFGLSDEQKSNNQIVFYTKENGTANLPQLVINTVASTNPVNTVPVTFSKLFSSNMILQQQSEVTIWGKAGIGAEITVTPSWNSTPHQTTADINGKWKVKINTPVGGSTAYEINVKDEDGHTETINNVKIGEVWFCAGQSNMEMKLRGFGGNPPSSPVQNASAIIAAANDLDIRVFTLPYTYSLKPQDDCNGSWLQANPTNAPEFSAVAYQYAKALKDKLNVPVGIIVSAVGGTTIQSWMSRESLQAFPEVSIPTQLQNPDPWKTTTSLFNGMVNPIAGFGIKGFLWYQGEANRHEPYLYQKLFSTMVNNWRTLWSNQNLPFYSVQIAPNRINTASLIGGGAKMREVQYNSAQTIAHSAVALCMDIGEENEIHYADKTTVAHRLSYIALNKTYGFTAIPFEGPKYQSVTFSGNVATLSFSHANGLKFSGNTSSLFEIAGADKVFKPAIANITPDHKITVSSTQVAQPVAVRYAFTDWVKGNLYNGDNLPASSFRTINWDEEATLPVKLIDFRGKVISNGILLEWISANESDNKAFEIQHSANGNSFRKIGELEGAGNANEKKYYAFTDKNPSLGINYYQLKQIDFNGDSSLSNPIVLNYRLLVKAASIYPNPTSDKLFVRLSKDSTEHIKLKLYSSAGSLLKSKTSTASAQDYLNVSDLARGTYILEIINNKNNSLLKRQKIIIQ
ncbi:MAG: DNRLRE domain-containing protein [Pedobacter sp.]|uniref:CBM96 family carbohydrate-binding protein n=1 Tax=Pedobacter sp. TaxID=1411316 RepID=UPI002808FD2A|nr:DNRLRE domain-containing protein [Pedobacter sp.]MDQ8005880.1 DNRLRE domain-containing protein [Pedobacter sp.]